MASSTELRFATIRQVAATGILSEHRLRLLHKQGALPGIQAGNRFLVNLPLLDELLQQESLRTLRRSNAPGNLNDMKEGETDEQKKSPHR